ncbi:MAG TPA: RNA 2',3'-cyclic phosphodiesterase [Bryobacteraceae bacterium]|jgi:2'-5' RNA ligase|nr:RNA 2',3'-cyclic phosphodiesterase [Bryobacteraceae bacterium]
MRLFTGIALDGNIQSALEQVLRELRPLAPLNWSPVENLHITTKFIGEWPEQRLDELKRALSAIPAPSAFPIHVAGFGYLPNPHHPRMMFAAVKAGPELAELARMTEEALVSLGIAKEERSFRPHLTLARIGNHPVRAVREHIAHMKIQDFGTFEASEFHLYLSTPRPGGSGSQYRSLAAFPLGSQA